MSILTNVIRSWLKLGLRIWLGLLLLGGWGSLHAASVTLEWDPSPDPLVTGYRLYWGLESGAYTEFMEIGFTNAATVSTLARAQTYYFVVTAANAAGVESIPSNEVEHTTPNNSPPIANPLNRWGSEDKILSVPLSGSDPDGTPLVFKVVRNPSRGVLSGTLPNLTYKPSANFFGTDSFDFTASDGEETSTPATVNITIASVNDVPVATKQSLSTKSGVPLGITLRGSDVDGDALTYAVVTPPGRGTLTGTPPSLTYTPQAGFAGTDSFAFVARDGKATSAAATVVISVASGNSAPKALSQSLATPLETTLSIQLAALDADGDELAYSIATPPYRGTLSGVPPNLTYQPNPGFAGRDSFTFSANDGKLNSTAVAVIITVFGSHQPPIAIGGSVTTAEDTPVGVVLAAYDPEEKPLSYEITVPPASGTLSGTPPNLVFTPNPDTSGMAYFAFRAFDGELYSEQALMLVSVSAVNDPPAPISLDVMLPSNQTRSIVLTGSDAENGPLTYSILTPPSHGILSGTPPNLTYQPHPGYVGPDRFEFTANDGELTSEPGVVTITVTEAPLSSGAALAGAPELQWARPADAGDPSHAQTWVVAPDSAVRGIFQETATAARDMIAAPTQGSVQLHPDGTFTYAVDATEALSDRFTVAGPAGPTDVTLSFLQLLPRQNDSGEFEWTFPSVPDARYWLQIHHGTPTASDVPSAWQNFTWGVNGLQGTVRIPVPAENAGAWFRLVSEQRGGVQVTAPVRLP